MSIPRPLHHSSWSRSSLPSWSRLEFPPSGWIALNTDGAVSNSTSLGSTAGLLRGSLGNWLGGFSKSLGITSPVHAEFEGLKLAWSQGYEKVQCQVDSSDVFNMVSYANARSSPLSLARSIASLRDRGWAIEYKLILRDANVAADIIAKSSLRQTPAQMFLDSAPSFLQNTLGNDISSLFNTAH
ncbi:hypothetical protein F3Y22_tig00110109pilonHSYRG00057 [Hibiscus syriacus]|uniref:RNase H type-1 domain-containing protein n=1 Tax=Hibiscus syriacus TaxID=106335 RepID=A0A6A3BKW2_HIBSY|nr:hypothetical protein F3Y22_tig00110109pilonHSYRG00057 [Hibiscus syriacus]